MKVLRSIVSVGGLSVASVALLLPISLLGLLDSSSRRSWPFTRLWAWIVLMTGGVERVNSSGLDHLRGPGPAVVMCNHESFLDPVVMMALAPAPLRFLARHDLFYLPVFGWAMWANGHIAVRRGSPAGARKCLRKAARILENGGRVLIYPEGSRANSKELLPFKNGGGLLAIRSNAPIIPVGIADTRKVCPRGWHLAGHSPVAMVVGTPIDTRPYSPSEVDLLMNLVRQRILELRAEAARMNMDPVSSRSGIHPKKLKNQES